MIILDEQKADKEQHDDYKSSTSKRSTDVRETDPPRWGKVPPNEYFKKYKKLDSLNEENFLNKLFGNGTATHSNPLVTQSPQLILPGMTSFDEPVLKYLRELSNKLNEELPVELDEDGFSKYGIHTTFDRLRTVSGYFMNPMSFVPLDNAAYREELGLDVAMSARHKAIFSELWDITFSSAKVSAINVPKLSTGGMRRFTSDPQWKLAYVEWLFEGNRLEKLLDAIERDDYITLANEFEMVFATYLQKRGQVDMPGKERIVFDLEYAKSGGKRGMAFAADKSVVINGVKYPDFSAMRARLIHAGPWVINCILQMIATPTMRALFHNYPDTFHINTKEQILEAINGKHVYCSDVADYDRSMGADDLRQPHEAIAKYYGDRLSKMSWKLVTSTYFTKPLDKDGHKGIWITDPRDPLEINAGNRSGHGLTSIFAKVNKVGDTACIVDLIYPLKGRMEEFLLGKMPMGVINNGDDEIVWAHDERDLELFKRLRSDLKNGRYVVTPEVGQGYSGLLLIKQDGLQYDAVSKVHTPLEKFFNPERSIGGLHRKYWPIGALERIDNIMKTPKGDKAWEITMRLYRDMLAPIYRDFMTVIIDANENLPIMADKYDSKSKAVLDDPSKLNYLYDQDEIHEDIVSLTTSKIPMEVNEKFLTVYYKGNLL